MSRPRDRRARRRPGARAVVAATCAVAVASLVLGTAGGTYALWNDALTVDLGTIELGTSPAPPPAQLRCAEASADPSPYHAFAFSPHPALDAWTRLTGILINPDTDSHTRLEAQVANDNQGIVHVNGGQAQGIGITPGAGEHASGVVRIVLGDDPALDADVVAEGLVWFTGNEWSNAVLVACGAPPARGDAATAP